MNLKLFIWLIQAILLGSFHHAEAQQPARVFRIGYLSGSSFNKSRIEAFRRRLHDLNYVEENNVTIEWRSAAVSMNGFPVWRVNWCGSNQTLLLPVEHHLRRPLWIPQKLFLL